jgi:hypothetical protein
MALFTMILEYRGTTAISQVRAPGAKTAVQKWTKTFDYGSVLGMGASGKTQLVKGFTREDPVPVKNTSNVWCATALEDGRMALLNIIRTAD